MKNRDRINKVGKRKKIIVLSIGILCFLWFCSPLFLMSSVNIGTVTGMLIGCVLCAYGIWMEQAKRMISSMWKQKYGRTILSVICTLCALILLTVIVFSACMISSNMKKPSENATVIVLGCRVYGDTPSHMLIERMDAAYEYLSKHENARCILSGGKGPGEDISEAECMYLYLTNKGIQSSRLYMESKSASTRENLIYSKEIIDKNKWSSEVAIVTNEFHEYRAAKVAESIDLTASAIPGKTAWWLFATYYMRELYGIANEFVHLK